MADQAQTRRYREATEQLLEQIDWCISYLNRIRKYDLARSVARNRDQIRRRLREQ
jgi:succinylglutamate desuccinylase